MVIWCDIYLAFELEAWLRTPPEPHNTPGPYDTPEGLARSKAEAELEFDPLLQILRAGNASGELQAWLAEQIAQGLFAKRVRPVDQRKNSTVWQAADDVKRIKDLWRLHYGVKRGLHARACEIAALRWGLAGEADRIATYLDRSKSSRSRHGY